MVIYSKDMKKEERKNMRGGDGTVTITSHVEQKLMKHCRLFSEMSLPPRSSIGEHDHCDEIEYYLIKEGTGIVVDEGVEKEVAPGDIVLTGGGAKHSIRNTGSTPLVITAVIITDAE
jgi:mannose-6-phosphate isomerase-like protein (cupin superfamily)